MPCDPCDHLRVHIKRILVPWNARDRFRVIGGTCQDCLTEVVRRDYPAQVEQPKWEEDLQAA